MSDYIGVIKYTLNIITQTYSVFFVAAFILLLIFILFKKKLNPSTYAWGRNLSLTLIGVVVVMFAVLAVPRVIDIRQESIIVEQNAQLYVTATQGDGADMFYGDANIDTMDGYTIGVVGINFFDLESLQLDKISALEPDIKYSGTAIYAKHSKQIISFVTDNAEEILNLPEE